MNEMPEEVPDTKKAARIFNEWSAPTPDMKSGIRIGEESVVVLPPNM